MIEITPTILLPEDELQIVFIHASGPGGQNVNKVATAVQLRFDVGHSASLPGALKTRLERLAGKRMTGEGVLILEARRTRSQEQNRLEAIERLVTLIQRAARPPKPRQPTRPSAAAKAARLVAKKKRGEIKRLRRRVDSL